MNKDKIYGEMGITVPKDNIICRNCKHRAPDIQINGALTVAGYKKGECEKYGDKPVGLNTIAALTGDEPSTIENYYEPFLMQLGMIQRTPKGRMVTSIAREHLGL